MPARRALDFEGFVMDVVRHEAHDWDESTYPFNLPAVKHWDKLPLHPSVTFLVGENGTGKSTLIEAIAIAAGFNPEGGTKNFSFATEESHSELSRHLRLVKSPKRIKDGFFLRAESFFNVATHINQLDKEPGPGAPIIESYGGRSLHAQSHGESFMALVNNRFSGNGLYVLDEPEAALSPQRQLALLARLHDLVGEGSQFIIATHSPILLAYPDAWIYQLDDNGPLLTDWENCAHVDLTRQFLRNPDSFLNILMENEDE